mmetsp:Transcript_8757/g.19469  ORF Transcript_8757/g.19469 Transcript_8757/m.19469 type:complete len:212 (+) Transcript_8757:521-1156(+)
MHGAAVVPGESSQRGALQAVHSCHVGGASSKGSAVGPCACSMPRRQQQLGIWQHAPTSSSVAAHDTVAEPRCGPIPQLPCHQSPGPTAAGRWFSAACRFWRRRELARRRVRHPLASGAEIPVPNLTVPPHLLLTHVCHGEVHLRAAQLEVALCRAHHLERLGASLPSHILPLPGDQDGRVRVFVVEFHLRRFENILVPLGEGHNAHLQMLL